MKVSFLFSAPSFSLSHPVSGCPTPLLHSHVSFLLKKQGVNRCPEKAQWMESRAGRSGNYIRKEYEGDVDSSWVFKNRVFCPVPVCLMGRSPPFSCGSRGGESR